MGPCKVHAFLLTGWGPGNSRNITAKIKTHDLEDFGEFCDSLMNFVQHTSKGASRIDFVFDSYLERSIKDSKRQKREKVAHRATGN